VVSQFLTLRRRDVREFIATHVVPGEFHGDSSILGWSRLGRSLPPICSYDGATRERSSACQPESSPWHPSVMVGPASESFRTLFEPHRRAITLHSYRMLGSLQEAEEVVQETLLRAW
jgi:hypothetical protein